MWTLLRIAVKLFGRLKGWQQAALVVLTPLVCLNLAVAFFGESLVNPLSPFYLSQKTTALEKYFKHRPSCLLHGHGDLNAIAREAEKKEHLPPGILQAVISVESGDRAHRISYAGAMGPAQLTADTAAHLGVSDPFDPHESIAAGAHYLKHLIATEGRLDLAIAAYNAGPGAVNGHVPDNGETVAYVAKVMRRYAALRD